MKTNYDHPFAFDTDLLVKHLSLLKDKQTIKKPIYDYVLLPSGIIICAYFFEGSINCSCIGLTVSKY